MFDEFWGPERGDLGADSTGRLERAWISIQRQRTSLDVAENQYGSWTFVT